MPGCCHNKKSTSRWDSRP